MLKKINGLKTYIGLITAGVFGIGISMGWMTWDDQWVQTASVLIATWTGVAMKHSADKKAK